jgi:hypothetical protein
MPQWINTYKAYSVSCFIVWAIIFIVGLVFGIKVKDHAVLYVFYGWVIGWLSATIARKVYKS